MVLAKAIPRPFRSKQTLVADRNGPLDLVRAETEGRGPNHARQHDHVVQLAHHPFHSHPVDHIPGPKIDDVQTTAGLASAPGQLLVKLKAAEGLVLTRP